MLNWPAHSNSRLLHVSPRAAQETKLELDGHPVNNTPRWYPSSSYRLVAVLKSRSIRSAVNLCVTVALLLPGGGIQAAAAETCCSSASTAKCEGCGRCQVSTAGERCGCCAKQQANTAPKKTTQRRSCCHRSTPEPAKAAEQTTEATHLCLCGSEPAPAAPAPQGRSTTEQLVKLLLTTPTLGPAISAGDESAASMQHFSVGSTFSPRDSQRRLCVWRI